MMVFSLTLKIIYAWIKKSVTALLSRPLLPATLLLAFGIALGLCTGISLTAAYSILLICMLAALAMFLIRKNMCWPLLFLSVCALGLVLCAGEMRSLHAFPVHEGEYAVVQGVVKGVPLVEDDGSYRLQLKVKTVDGQPVDCADIYVYGEGKAPLSGSLVEVDGKCADLGGSGNANAFDYGEFLQQQGIAACIYSAYDGSLTVVESGSSWLPSNWCMWLRECFARCAQDLTESQRSLIYGVFLGEGGDLQYEQKNAFGLSGVMHVFAVSGLHVGYIVMLALALAGSGFKRRGLRMLLCCAMLLLYVGLCGLAASIVRAAVMAVLMLTAEMLMEEGDSLSTLSLAAMICLIIHPLWLINAGFLMSFAATVGIIMLSPLMKRSNDLNEIIKVIEDYE